MAISDRQAAAIARRKRQARVDRDLTAEQARTGHLMGFSDTVASLENVVGWADGWAVSMKGRNHVCIRCQPANPGGTFLAVHRHRLAARSACTQCGTVLETVGLAGHEKKEK